MRDEGLRQDTPLLIETATSRRQMFAWLAAGGTVLAANVFAPGTSAVAACLRPDEETAGPFPADGSRGWTSNVASVLTKSGIVRSDIRSSFGNASGVATGVPLELSIRLVDTNNDCSPLEGYAVYIWHCTADGKYSLYGEYLRGDNFLRGVQVADRNGELTFTTVFPGCYRGRYPHMHFEVFRSLEETASYRNEVLTSQIPLAPEDCEAVYVTEAYADSVKAYSRISLDRDPIFQAKTREQLDLLQPKLSGSPGDRLRGSLTIGI